MVPSISPTTSCLLMTWLIILFLMSSTVNFFFFFFFSVLKEKLIAHPFWVVCVYTFKDNQSHHFMVSPLASCVSAATDICRNMDVFIEDWISVADVFIPLIFLRFFHSVFVGLILVLLVVITIFHFIFRILFSFQCLSVTVFFTPVKYFDKLIELLQCK